MLAEGAVGLADARVDGDDVYWIEGRASEGGRQVLVRLGHGDVVGPGVNVRSRVYEYGGTPYAVRGGVVAHVAALEPGDGTRYADLEITPDGGRVLAVRERRRDEEVVHDLVALPREGGEPAVLASGRDFYSAPRLSPDGKRLAYMTWDLPDMPWDSSRVWLANADGSDARCVAGGPGASASQPQFSPDGVLHWVDERSGFWNLYREGSDEPLAAADAEFSGPGWHVGQSTYAWLADGTLVAAWVERGIERLGLVRDGAAHPLDVPFTQFESLQGQGDTVVCLAGSARDAASVVRIRVPDGEVERLHVSRELPFDAAYVSEPQAIEFPTAGGGTAHALFYPPTNPEFRGPETERPPVIVVSHGGPTGRTTSALHLVKQFFTSRGIGVVDVNYRGSTGYGQAYRNALRGLWGIADVEDCVAAARHLVATGEADGDRLVVRGGSAGGYTTLQALTTTDVFAAGSSHFGVADCEALAQDTHKLESRYLDSLIGPWPEAADVYRERSPLHHADRLSTPLILFQGLEDRVVPPEQAEVMRAALDRQGIPHALLAFEGEGHGFRSASTIRRVAEAELAFLGRVLGFAPADDLPPLEIEHAPRLGL
jgi:dipeptidyl aminopeptidase/acylaminoacyl peptidase